MLSIESLAYFQKKEMEPSQEDRKSRKQDPKPESGR
jgi:hypothetical protein